MTLKPIDYIIEWHIGQYCTFHDYRHISIGDKLHSGNIKEHYQYWDLCNRLGVQSRSLSEWYGLSQSICTDVKDSRKFEPSFY